MQTDVFVTRRRVLAGAAGLTVLLSSVPRSRADTLPKMTVTKDPSCDCCSGWVEHIRGAGFSVGVIESSELNRVKARLGVPASLASCHTAELGGYVVEGHVPAEAIRRLLSEKPSAKGLAVPGMPVGSPGMEMEGTSPDAYDVILFDGAGQRTFARFRGTRLL